jgi:hypothetical protein
MWIFGPETASQKNRDDLTGEIIYTQQTREAFIERSLVRVMLVAECVIG